MSEKITFTNSRGQSVDIANRPPYLLSNPNGLGDVNADIQRQKAPLQDGSTFIDSVLDERILNFEVAIIGDNEADVEEKRVYLASVFNPKLGEGLLRFKNEYGIKEIKAVADGVPTFPSGTENRGRTYQRSIVNLICPDPYWKSLSVTEEPAFEGLFSFPFEGEFQMGMQRDRRIINNDGNAPAPLQVEFFGPALNPKIINNTTGEYIKVNQNLLEGEIMKIDTSDTNKSVVFIGVDGSVRNVFNWIDLNSTFFKLVIGENDIEYTADSDIQGAIVNISYSKLYTAV
ncbi:phage tail protein [Domibacillus antri]|uniref:Phage tail protein n=1 Tax=Domibacillus antri TaxID=1714264 RepID=A0A1Q8Q3I6_9BACI|nr:phage tail family protein [Domibacillus antri]OLN21909.1 phage tail protein [Domibacillus antri]